MPRIRAAFNRLPDDWLVDKFGYNSEKLFYAQQDVDSNLAHTRRVKILGGFTRALRNVSRKIRALLVIIAQGLPVATLISIPTGIIKIVFNPFS